MALCAAATLLLSSAPARAVTKAECAAAYEDTQSLRQESKLRRAKEQAIVCAQTACPGVVRNDCVKWLSEIDASLPSVVFAARDTEDRETTAVRVFFDGEPLREKTDGKAVFVDPGEHTFRFELAGQPAIEQRAVLREGDKLRTVHVTFARPAPPVVAPASIEEAKPTTSPLRTAAFAIGGVGLASIGVGIVAGAVGLAQKSELEGDCAPACSASRIDDVRTKLVVADIAAAVGVVAVGAAAVLYFVAPRAAPDKPAATSRPVSRAGLGIAPRPGGAFASAFVSF